MSVQTSYSASLPAGFPGLLYDTGDYGLKTAAIQGEASAEIPFGVFVARGASSNALTSPKAVQLASAADPLFGVVIHSHAYNRETDLGSTGLKPRTVMSILEVGGIWVLCEAPMTQSSLVYTRFATGAGGVIRGAVRPDADTNTALLVKGARLLTPTISVTVLGQTALIAAIHADMLTQRATA